MKRVTKKKKPIDLISEIDGKPVYPPCKKEKVLDLTDEIKFFLKNDVTPLSIKRILLRLNGPINDHKLEKSVLTITKISKWGYFILLTSKGHEYEYYICAMTFIELGFWRSENILTSRLKSDLRHKIYNWLEIQNKIKEIENGSSSHEIHRING